MTKLADYQRAYPTIKLERTADGILEMTLHNNGGPYVWDFHGTIKDKTRQSSGGAQRELADALEAIARDPENKIVILTGTGDQFSGPSATKESFPRGDPEYWEVLRATDHRLVMGLLDIPVPVISCINGPAYRHAEIPFFADIVLAAEGALIQDSAHFPNRTVPGDSVNLIFPFLMGWIRGRYFLYTGQKMDAKEMKELGLVNEVLPREKLLPRARELAAQMVQNNPLALRYTRLILTAPLKAFIERYLPYTFAMEALAAVHESTGKVGFTWDEPKDPA